MALGCTVEELLQRISSRELSEWLAFAQIEPFGEERDDLRTALLASVVANVITRLGGGKHTYKLSDFLLKFDEPGQDSRAQLDVVKQWQAILMRADGSDR